MDTPTIVTFLDTVFFFLMTLTCILSFVLYFHSQWVWQLVFLPITYWRLAKHVVSRGRWSCTITDEESSQTGTTQDYPSCCWKVQRYHCAIMRRLLSPIHEIEVLGLGILPLFSNDPSEEDRWHHQDYILSVITHTSPWWSNMYIILCCFNLYLYHPL